MKIQLKAPEARDNGNRGDITKESTFEAKILSVVHRDTKWDATDREGNKLLDEDGNYYKNKEFNFKFVILGDPEISPDSDPRWVWGSTSDWFSTDARCKLANWIKAILDEPVLPEGFAIDPEEDLDGCMCRIVVQAKKRDDGSYSNWVSDIFPSKGVTQTTQDRVQEQQAETPAYDPAEEPF